MGIESLPDKFHQIEDIWDFLINRYSNLPSTTIVTAMAASEPKAFYDSLEEHSSSFRHLNIYLANPTRNYPCLVGANDQDRCEFRVLFLTSFVRNLQGSRLYYTPQHLSAWSRHILSASKVDVFWGSCSLPDKNGFVSLGPGVCYESEILRHAETVILECNPNIPRVHGSGFVDLRDVHFLLSSNHKLAVCQTTIPSEIEERIAFHISELIPNGATLQFGIGNIPNALTDALKGKKDLGIHTEMMNNAIMHLIKLGAVNGSKKTLWPNKTIGSFAWGSEELYRFIDDNPSVELYPSSIVNDPNRIGRNRRMFSINTCVEMDLTGQVCSESIGHLEISGTGGASETHIGAQRSEGGAGIIAFPSRSKTGASRIKFELAAGAKVSISRNDVDTIVTEYGVAKLKGKSVQARGRSLISIAHPDFRDELKYLSQKSGYL